MPPARTATRKFDVEDNDIYSCIWHDGIVPSLLSACFSNVPSLAIANTEQGNKEADYEADIWAYHEPWHGAREDLYDDSYYAKGFKYDCCDRYGDNEGCKTGTHVEYKSVYKKMRR